MSALHIEMMEEGVLSPDIKPSTPSKNIKLPDGVLGDDYGYLKMNKKSLMEIWGLLVLYCIFAAVGFIGGPLLLRVYFLHGGSRKWLSSALKTAGFPILLLPLAILYAKPDRVLPQADFFVSPKLLLSSIFVGILVGVISFMYSYVNAIVVMTLGSVLLGVGQNGDRPEGVTSLQYLLGFALSIGTAPLGGFVLPCIEVAYTKANKIMTFPVVLQYQFYTALSATDFPAMQREANEFGLGKMDYYLVLVPSAVVFQISYIGTLGIIFCATSLFAGVVTAVLLPLTEIAAVIVFHENFTGQKGMSLALSVWGFLSYFYGTYKETRIQKQTDNTKAITSE
ncbi:hypothetical protein MKX03_023308 [Papaver bracteatum]|nr:hypothetical protein MKX03_023308 [Papaver bracteatum]